MNPTIDTYPKKVRVISRHPDVHLDVWSEVGKVYTATGETTTGGDYILAGEPGSRSKLRFEDVPVVSPDIKTDRDYDAEEKEAREELARTPYPEPRRPGIIIPHAIKTVSGRYFNFLNPDPESIDIEDIAHSLSHIARFTGHTRVFYPVAQHCVLVSHWVGQRYAMQGLMHDATEAYVGDVSRPLKDLLPAYREIEDRVWLAIAEKFNLPPVLHPSVKEMDNVLLVTEKRDLTTPGSNADDEHFWSWSKDIKPLEMKITPWSPDDAKKIFLDRFHFLTALR